MLERKNDYKAWLYLLPALIAIAIFTIYPIINTMIISFNEGYNHLSPSKWGLNWGFGNYSAIFGVKGYEFQRSLVNTLIIVVISVPLTTIVSLLIAIGLNSIKPLQKIFQVIFFTPYVTNSIAIGMVFAMVFGQSSTGGLLNTLFGTDQVFLEATAPYWLKHVVLQVFMLWEGLAFKILIFLGGLQSIGKQYYDAARIDGTPKSRITWKITLPLLSPTISYILITSVIGAFKTYTSVVGLFSNASSASEMMTMVGFVYEYINVPGGYGMAAAGSVILFGIILVITAIQYVLTRKRVHY